jgi:hypothetical protein
MAASMSPLVTRPSLLVPGTEAGSSPVSPAIRRTDGGSRGSGGSGSRTRGSGRRFCRFTLRRGGAAARADRAEQCADGDRFPVFCGNFRQHAGGRSRHLDRHLVGFEFDQRLVDSDRFARLLEPLADGRFGHRLAKRRYPDFGHEV